MSNFIKINNQFFCYPTYVSLTYKYEIKFLQLAYCNIFFNRLHG